MSFEVQGLDRCLRMFVDVANLDGVEEGMQDACSLVEREAVRRAPKDTGELRRSIQSKVDRDGDSIEGTVFTSLFYAPYVEYGTGLFAEGGNGRKNVPWHYKDVKGNWHETCGMKPQPYMRPALESEKSSVIEKLKEGVYNG